MKRILWLLLVFSAVQLQAQDITQYKRVVKELSSARYQGRGYAKGGANKAGKFLEKEFRKIGADDVTLQPFTIDINTFPYYHTIFDNWKTAVFTSYEPVFKLVTEFLSRY